MWGLARESPRAAVFPLVRLLQIRPDDHSTRQQLACGKWEEFINVGNLCINGKWEERATKHPQAGYTDNVLQLMMHLK